MKGLKLGLSFQAHDTQAAGFTSEPSVFTSWGLEELQHDVRDTNFLKELSWGAVVGCEDGSLYVFHPELSRPKNVRRRSEPRVSTQRNSNSNMLELPQLPYRRPHHLSFSRSRDVSPIGARTTLTVTSHKSRAVSGLSREQVEAPKNFVDFEDEQERMKDMISDRSVKDVKERSPRASVAPMESPRRRALDDALSLASIDTSSSKQTPPISPPLSPPLELTTSTTSSLKSLALRVHIVPRHFGVDHGIVDIKVLKKERIFVALQKSGQILMVRFDDGHCLAVMELGSMSSTPSSRASNSAVAFDMWSWHTVDIFNLEKTIIVAIGRPDERIAMIETGDATEQTRIVVLEATSCSQHTLGRPSLLKLSDLTLEGPADSTSVVLDPAGDFKVYQIDEEGSIHVFAIPLAKSDFLVAQRAPEVPKAPPLSEAITSFMSRLEQNSGQSGNASETESEKTRMELLTGKLPFSSPGNIFLKMRVAKDELHGLAWSDEELVAFEVVSDFLRPRAMIKLALRPQSILWSGLDTLSLRYEDRQDNYILPVAKSDGTLSTPEKASGANATKISTLALKCSRASLACNSHPTLRLSVDGSKYSVRAFHDEALDNDITLWIKSFSQKMHNQRVTSLLALDLDHIVVASDSAELQSVSTSDLLNWKSQPSKAWSRKNPFVIVSLFMVASSRTGQKLMVGGGDDGSISFWDARSLKLRARWIVFMEPLSNVISFDEETAGQLRNCCVCISIDGTIAVISIENLSFLYLIPGAPARLSNVSVTPDNLMLSYLDGRVRLWDLKTKEFRRSMRLDKAAELLSQGGWHTMSVSVGRDADGDRLKYSETCSETEPVGYINLLAASGNPSPLLSVDIESFLIDHANMISSQRNIKAFLRALHTPGLDDQLDRLASDVLDFKGQKPDVLLHMINGFTSSHSFFLNSASGIWCISPVVTALRLLAITSLLRALASKAEYEVRANTLLSFYSVTLPLLVGSSYQPPSLSLLVAFWDDSMASEIRASAKDLFDCELARMDDESIITVVEEWRHGLPYLLPPDERQSKNAALCLSLCGKIATERYNLLTTTSLSDVSKSITLYLNDESSPHRALAIDLCARGFEIWQLYIDAKDALRSIFVLATASSKSVIWTRNPGPVARSAVIQIASNNSPLFMTTLSLDILHPRSVEYSKVIMQMIAFVIRRRPLVLLPNLPRLMEAVVKSLDPASNSDREAVLDTATEVIALVVQTYPTLDFHGGSQRLAVGTSEGAVIMYDLKTATRLYVLEGHRKRLSGISFSPDGRRMVTLSVEESIVLVWKVGTSFVSFFNPGAPPRQGHGGSDPYKSLPFVLQDQASLTMEAILREVMFEWPSDRTVRVSIREAVFTFST